MFAIMFYLKDHNYKVCNPILFDASCSGIQHIASLTLEKELASNVNVYSESLQPKDDLPEDFYTYALSKINDRLKKSDIPELREIKLTRKIIKRSVMTIPYNISMVGVSEQLMEHFEEMWVLKDRFIKIPGSATEHGNEIVLTPSQYGNLSKIIYQVLTIELPSLKMLTDYFNSMIDIFINLNLPISWITPAGLKISYSNIKFKSIRIKANILPTMRTSTIKLPTDSFDKLTMKRSFMPNLIHSLDAANVHLLLANIATLNLPVYTVHDCFAGTPNNMLTMEKLVKEAFIDIYFKDEGYLLKLHKHFVESILSATDQIYTKDFDTNTPNTLDNEGNKTIDVMNRFTNEIISIPELPKGYTERNKDLTSFIKGLLNSKYFIG